jgi:predicted phage baseplate assembly protein
MTVEEVMLDDRRYEDLLSEAHTLVRQKCPLWTDAKAADPGITLIELFAWMTDMLSYRINRLPEKAHVALLNLLDVQLEAPRAARTDLRLMLEHPPTRTIHIRARETEAATLRTPTQESIVFRTASSFRIPPLHMSAYLLKRDGDLTEVTIVGDRGALPTGKDSFAFSQEPKLDDSMLLGFPASLDRLVMRVEVECDPAYGVGIDPHHPPLAWAVSIPDDKWLPLLPLSDSTNGFNKPSGAIELELPEGTARQTIGLHRLYWLRCALDPEAAEAAHQKIYTRSPRISALGAAPIGASVPAEHSQTVEWEPLGRSDGTPGQTFKVRNAPVLPLGDGERLEVCDRQSRHWRKWTRVKSFAKSKPQDPHFLFDESGGEVEFGPAVRQPGGAFRQYGAVPAVGSVLRFSAYRHGGGSAGNVGAETLTQLRRPIAGVRSVTNPRAASEGMDGESLAHARTRVAIDRRTGQRAITGEDFEDMCVAANKRVARARCLGGDDGQPARVYIVPHVDRPQRGLSATELEPKPDLLEELAGYLNECRLVGTTISLAPARYRAVSVVVRARAEAGVDREKLRQGILRALYIYLNPLIGGSASGENDDEGEGWSFGRDLKRGELYPLVEGVAGVARVVFVRVYETDLASGEQSREQLDGDLTVKPEELIVSGAHRVQILLPEPQ